MKVLVTGGTGLVGTAMKNIKDDYIYLSSKDGDLRKETDVKAIFERYSPNVVIHLAANVGGLYKNMHQKAQMYEDNMLMNTLVLKHARLCGVEKVIVMLSTCIFPDDIGDIIREDDLHIGPPHPSNEGYAYAKRMMEVHGRILHKECKMQVICISPTNIYGPYDNFSLEDAHVIPALIHKCWIAKKNNEPFIVKGSGKPLRQFIYSNDLAKCIIQMVSKNDIGYGHFICAPKDSEISIEYVARSIAKCIDYEDAIVFDKSYADGQYKKTVEPNPIFANTHFTSFEEGIKTTVNWFVKNVDESRKIRM